MSTNGKWTTLPVETSQNSNVSYCSWFIKYRKIQIISPGLITVQKAALLGLFSGEFIFGGAYLLGVLRLKMGWVSQQKQPKTLWKQPKTANTNSLWVYIREGLLSEGFLRLRFRGAYFRKGLFLETLIIGIIRYTFYRMFFQSGVSATVRSFLINLSGSPRGIVEQG